MTRITPDDVRERLGSARKRKDELIALNGGDLAGADPRYRQQLVQEFFFHLVGAVEALAHYADETRSLGLGVEDASPSRVTHAIPSTDPLQPALDALYHNTRPGRPVPADPYRDDGLLYRIWNYRHQVTHRGRQPWHFNAGDPDPRTGAPGHSTHLIVDPREPPSSRDASKYEAQAELDRMLDLVSKRCEAALVLV